MAKRAQRPAASEPNPAMRRRVIVDAVTPQVDDGRYPARRTVGEDVVVEAAVRHHRDIARDIAFQASPDHPYVTAHPSWFRHRPDGTIKYAENPPKKYQDIY